MSQSPRPAWRLRDRVLDLAERPLVMGILNITPDSFSDGGEFFERDAALRHAEQMIREGADLIDIGGESTRPGAEPVGEDEELGRVVPVVESLSSRFDVALSVDTQKSVVARAAMAAGAHVLNDVSGLSHDPALAGVAAETGAGLVLMHMRGEPRTMQLAPRYDDLMAELRADLLLSLAEARARGVAEDAIVLDPGIGFGKTFRHNWEVLARLGELAELGRPLMIGTSRKGFLRARVGEVRGDLQVASLATAVVAWMHGARIVRVHDVRAHRLAAETLAALWAAGS